MSKLTKAEPLNARTFDGPIIDSLTGRVYDSQDDCISDLNTGELKACIDGCSSDQWCYSTQTMSQKCGSTRCLDFSSSQTSQGMDQI